MYRQYDSSERIFVDREEYIQWMEEALQRCKEKSVILHLRGIGGIGKSSLLNYWTSTIDSTVRLDCQQYTEFYSRLDNLAKGAVRVGLNLQRFDLLWHIRKRFVEGVEPASEKGREWAKEVLVAIPFIGSLASIGSAIKAVSDSVAPKLRKKYGEVGEWLQERLGSDYVERLLEVLWKEPQHAEFLYLDALLEDINNRKNVDEPILFLFDHSENVDSEELRWRYSGRRITEMELWYVFISSLQNCVGVVASRLGVPSLTDKSMKVEERELTELDQESCVEFLEKRSVTSKEMQEKIVSVSAGNPFIIDAICDMHDTQELTLNEIETLRAETLDDVRLKTWRRLFSHAKDLLNLVDRVGILPSFDKESMEIIAPNMKTDQWERLIRLSFVKIREDGSRVLHDLARDLVRAELGKQLDPLVTEISGLLEVASDEEKNPALQGIALSVKALASEMDAITEVKNLIQNLIDFGYNRKALAIIENTVFHTIRGQAEIKGLHGKVLADLNRFVEAEIVLRESVELLGEVLESDSEQFLASTGEYDGVLGYVLYELTQFDEAEQWYLSSEQKLRKLAKSGDRQHIRLLSLCLAGFAFYYYRAQRAPEGVDRALEALELIQQIENQMLLSRVLNITAAVLGNVGRYDEAYQIYQKAIELTRKLIEQPDCDPRTENSLAGFLGNSSFFIQDDAEWERIYEEIFEIREKFREQFPTALAFTKIQYGLQCIARYKPKSAERGIEEAIAIYQELGKISHGSFTDLIAMAELLLVEVYLFSYRMSDAKLILAKAKSPETFNAAELSEYQKFINLIIFSIYGLYYSMTNYQKEAISAYRQSLGLLNFMKIDSTEEVLFSVMSLNNYGVLLSKLRNLTEARVQLKRGIDIISKFGESPAFSLKPILLGNLALIQHLDSDYREAEENYVDAIKELEELSQSNAIRFLLKLATTLNNYSLLQREKEEANKAVSILKRSIEIKRRLVETNPALFNPFLMVALNNYGVLLIENNRRSDALDAFQEALAIKRVMFEKAPEMFSAELATTLHNLGLIMKVDGNEKKSRDYFQESFDIKKKLFDRAPDMFPGLEDLTIDDLLEEHKWSVELEPSYGYW
ncbi:MAG: tetratricopeptide repeat protein [Candidatus Thorarchaeota archaeon]